MSCGEEGEFIFERVESGRTEGPLKQMPDRKLDLTELG